MQICFSLQEITNITICYYSQSKDARRIVRNFTLHIVHAIDITTSRQCVGEDQLLDLTLSTTKINHSLHSTAVQMIKNVHFCAKIFTSKVQFRLLLHTQVTKNLKNEIKMIIVSHGRKQFSKIRTKSF